MTLQEQADILAAAVAGKTLEQKSKHITEDWRLTPPDHQFSFDYNVYRVKEEPRILHQYIIKPFNKRLCLTYHFYATAEEARVDCPFGEIVGPASWTRIEVPA